MAVEGKKFEFAVANEKRVITGATIPAYREGDICVHQRTIGDEVFWTVSHVKTGCRIVGDVPKWTKKRYAKAYADHMNTFGINWDFSDEKAMYKLNNREFLIRACKESLAEAQKLVDGGK